MGYWGKLIGGAAGLAMGGPLGAVLGATLGHAADAGGLRLPQPGGIGAGLHPARLAALFARREQMLGLSCVILAARLCKIDGPVNRAEIDAFKRHFRVAPEQIGEIARLFDQARDSSEPLDPYVRQLGERYADDRGTLEDALAALFGVARADGPLHPREEAFLRRTARGLGLDEAAWDRARGAAAPRGPAEPGRDADPYVVLGVKRSATGEQLRAAWKRLMRDTHPDALASQGAAPAAIARAGERVARINAAWDRIKRERQL